LAMEGFTVQRSNQFLETGRLQNDKQAQVSPQSSVEGPGPSFSETLKEAVQSVNDLQKKSDAAMQNLATGRTDNVAEVMIASEKADIALKLMVQVRNKMIEAYQEVMRMQV
jgi:flagellar hook-basal body complex protein FliE